MDLLSLLRLRKERPAFDPGAELSQTRGLGAPSPGQLRHDGSKDLEERLEGKTALLFRAVHWESRLGSGKDGAAEDLS